jgi:hypothetical protein
MSLKAERSCQRLSGTISEKDAEGKSILSSSLFFCFVDACLCRAGVCVRETMRMLLVVLLVLCGRWCVVEW